MNAPHTTPSASPRSAGSGATRFRVRKDLQIEPQVYAGQPCFVVKDPLSLSYYHFSPAQFELWQLVDGRTRDELRAAARHLGPDAVSGGNFEPYLLRLMSCGLIVPDFMQFGALQFQWRRRQEQLQFRSRLTSLLYIRISAIDPDALLTWLHRKLHWLFTPLFLACAALFVLAVGTYTAVRADDLLARIQSDGLSELLSGRMLFWLWLSIGVCKVIHEFGHGLTCKHYGGECHDMGLLFLVLSPCLYCDASDAWTMPDKWHRMAVSAAGIGVELLIASAAALIWWHTADGIPHRIAFALMTLCSLTTVLLNANPLMRYDGYYLLSDLLEVPNLQQRAANALRALMDSWMGLGRPEPHERTPPPVLIYAVCAWAYRWALCIAIVVLCYRLLRPYRLASVSLVFAAVIAVQLLLLPAARWILGIYHTLRHPVDGTQRTFRPRRLLGAAVAAAALAGVFFLAPLPRSVRAPLTLEGRERRPIQVNIPGRLESVAVHDGQTIPRGAPLCVLSNLDLQQSVLELEQDVAVLSARAARFEADHNPDQWAAVVTVLQHKQAELEQRRQQIEHLTLRAPVSGRIAVARAHSGDTAAGPDDSPLPGWAGAALDPENLGAQFERGAMLAEIVPDGPLEAVLYVDQSDMPFVAAGQTVQLKLDAFPALTLRGIVAEIAQRDAVHVPDQLLSPAGGQMSARKRPDGSIAVADTTYEVRVQLAASLPHALPGCRGRARIACGTWTCWEWLSRHVRRLFQV